MYSIYIYIVMKIFKIFVNVIGYVINLEKKIFKYYSFINYLLHLVYLNNWLYINTCNKSMGKWEFDKWNAFALNIYNSINKYMYVYVLFG